MYKPFKLQNVHLYKLSICLQIKYLLPIKHFLMFLIFHLVAITEVEFQRAECW